MDFLGLLFLLIVQYLIGAGIMHLCNITEKKIINIAIAMICGVVVTSYMPVTLQFFYIPITKTNIAIALLITAFVLNIKRLIQYKSIRLKPDLSGLKNTAAYEWLFIILLIVLMIPSVWKCYYYPAYARDILSGPEIIADYTIKEKTMLNSVLSLNLESTNNHLKPPFVSGLQIVYKMFVMPFGQTWLTILALAFLVFLYNIVRQKLHPIITGVLMLYFIMVPELYAYSYIILFDYSNMILLFCAVYFFSIFALEQKYNYLVFSILLFGFATAIRAETLVLIYMCIPMLWYLFYKHKAGIIKSIGYTAFFVIVPFLVYYIWVGIFLKYYMPGGFSVDNELNKNLFDFGNFYKRLSDSFKLLLYGGDNIRYYGYLINITTLLFIADVIIKRKLTAEARITGYVLLVLLIGIPLLGHVFPLYDFQHTTKRGFFKIFPFLLLLLRNNSLLLNLSQRITNWENGVSEKKIAKAVVATPQQQTTKKKNKK